MKQLLKPGAALALVAALVAAAPAARAANLVVTRLADTPLAGQCTLREALQAAASNADAGGCVGSGAYGDDTTTFDASGTIVLGSTLQVGLGGRVVIDGVGQRVTVSGNRAVRVFTLTGGGQLELRRITVADGFSTTGSAGVNVNSNSDLIVSDSSFVGHQASGGGDGSAIWHFGGIAPRGSLHVSNSSFVGNGGQNVVISFLSSDLPSVFTNNTFTGNPVTESVLRVFFATLRNLLAGNGARNCNIAPRDAGGNLDDDSSCGFSAPTSKPGIAGGLDPAGLRDNGGPTMTVALCRAAGDPTGCTEASAAIDAAADCPPPAANQRGVARPQGAGCDIGAFEAGQARYSFNGLYSPVNNAPVVNAVKAGAAVPVKFSLGGDFGLVVFAPGYPALQPTACTGGASDDVEQTVAAGASGLQYDAASATYTFVWKTSKAWGGQCATLLLRFDDGTQRQALFRFK